MGRDAPIQRLALLTTGRHDWATLRPVWEALQEPPAVEALVLAGGMHLSSRYGATIGELRAQGVDPAAELAWLTADGVASGRTGDGSDLPATEQAGSALSLAGQALKTLRPDALLVVGDRFETAAVAIAATILSIPIAHLHGGEETLGAFDDSLRHAISKLAHLHLAASETSAARLRALGEHPSTIHVVGPPSVDNMSRTDLPDRPALERDLGLDLVSPVVIVTVHPTTRGEELLAETTAVIATMDAVPATYVITLPNADPGNEAIRDALLSAADRPRRAAFEALGDRRYWALMRQADAILGNSSSGIIEAPALDLPAVNVGDRQAGRERGGNVVDVPSVAAAVTDALRRALSPDERARIAGRHNPLHDGQAGRRTADVLRGWRPPRPPRKLPVESR